ncbi:MAG: DUF3662 and FHA domain-containing protein [Firmicutes bacterium]|nr:DUF3662 and FHA domain-containing protein [Bacillota bacterium]
MGLLRKLEAFLERILRSLAGRGAQRLVQPVEIGRQLAKAMLADRKVSTVHVYVPNQFTVHVNPHDWEKLEPLKATIITDLGEYLNTRARRNGVRFVAPVEIKFQVDEDVSPGLALVDAAFREKEHNGQATLPDKEKHVFDDGNDNSGNGTQMYRLSPGVTHNGAAELLCLDGSEKGQTWLLTKELATIGRGFDQYVQLREPSISRCHAVIHFANGRYCIEDNQSTNGIMVNNQSTLNAMLNDGDLIQLGTVRLRFRLVK